MRDRGAGVLRRARASCCSPSACCSSPRAPRRSDTAKAIAEFEPGRPAGHRPAVAHPLRQRRLPRLSGGGELKTGRARCSPARPTCRNRSIACRRPPSPARRRARTCASPRRRPATARWPGTASASGRSKAPRARAPSVWTVSDETREHDRHETFFQDLQHAIDYLDHAPAGFFSAEPDGAIVHMNATLAEWLDYDLAQFGLGQLKVGDIIAGDGGAMLATMSGRPGEVKTAAVRRRSQAAPGPGPAGAHPAQGRLLQRRRARTVALAGHQPRARARSRARRICAPPRSGSPASSTRRRSPSPRSRPTARCCAPTPPSPGSRPRALKAAGGDGKPSIFSLVAERDHGAPARGARGGRRGQGPDRAARRHARGRGAGALGAAVRLGRRSRKRRGRERDRLRARHDRAARPAGEPRPEPEDAGDRPARRRRRARLQQRADRDHRLFRPPARQPPADRPVLPGHHADQAERQPGGGPGAAAARLLAPADAEAADAAAQRRPVGTADAAAPPRRRADRARRRPQPRPVAGQGRPQPVRAGHRQSRRQRPRRDAGRRQDHAAHPQRPGGGMRELQGRERRSRRLRAGRGRGHRARHPGRGAGQDLRAVLHHQGGRQGHGPRPVDGLRHRQADRRLRVLRQRAGQGRDLPHPAAAPDRGRGRGAGEAGGREARRRPDRPRRHPAGRGRGGGARLRLARARLARLYGARGRNPASRR